MANAGKFEEVIDRALRRVVEPTGRNLMDAGIVATVTGEDAGLVVVCRDPGFPEPIRNRLTNEIRSNIQKDLPQLEKVTVEWRSASAGGGQPGPAPAAGPETLDVKHVVAVGSGKGGVGKSTIAASLAYALRQRDLAVGLMDADVYGPSIPHLLGLSGPPDVVDNRYQPKVMDGIRVMSMGFLVPEEQAVVWRGPMLHKAVRDFLYLVDWGRLDYLIVDLPPGTGDVVLSLSQQMPVTGGVIVCTPQDVALLDAKKALNMLGTVKIPCRGIVENMSFFECPGCGHRSEIFGHGGAEAWAKRTGTPFLGHVPINLNVRINGDEGRLRDNFVADCAVRQHLLGIADNLIENIAASDQPAAPKLEID